MLKTYVRFMDMLENSKMFAFVQWSTLVKVLVSNDVELLATNFYKFPHMQMNHTLLAEIDGGISGNFLESHMSHFRRRDA